MVRIRPRFAWFLAGSLALWAAMHAQDAAPAPDKTHDQPEPNAPAQAERGTADDPLRFENLDTDGDGRLVLSEFTAPAAKLRKSGKAGTNDVTGAPGPERTADDGIVSSADTLEGRYSPEVFKNLDVDHDDSLSPAEFEALAVNAHNISQP